ncbi:hypothetical protein G9A89_016873 [Geosiphon pyriformis]|nr:hypothetical protein G9A89_016873 [Geosiphon pyriformis]
MTTEYTAFLSWMNSHKFVTKRLTSFTDLADGVAFGQLLYCLDAESFKPCEQYCTLEFNKTNWKLQYIHLAEIYVLVMQYFEREKPDLLLPLTNMEPPNVYAIARNSDISELLKLCYFIYMIDLIVNCTTERLKECMPLTNSEASDRVEFLIISPSSPFEHLVLKLHQTIQHNHDQDDLLEHTQNDDALNELNDLQQENLELEAENKLVQTKCEYLKIKLEEEKTKIENLNKSISSLKLEKWKFQNKLNELNKEFEYVRAQADEAVHLKTEIKMLKGKLQDSEEQNAHLISMVDKSREEALQLELELKESAKHMQQIEITCQEFENANNSLGVELMQNKKKCQELLLKETENAALNKTMREHETVAIELLRRIKKLQSEKEHLQEILERKDYLISRQQVGWGPNERSSFSFAMLEFICGQFGIFFDESGN